jgi:hypothetical protein
VAAISKLRMGDECTQSWKAGQLKSDCTLRAKGVNDKGLHPF